MLVSFPGSGKVLLDFSIRNYSVAFMESGSRLVWSGESPSIAWGLKHNWRNVGVLQGTPLPNRSATAGVMLCYVIIH